MLAVGAGGILWWRTAFREPEIQILASEPVRQGTVRQVLEQTGIIKSQVGAIVKIGARATGTIEHMFVKVGDRVDKDQIVARIDSRELIAQAAEARAQLASARAELSRIQGTYPLRVAEAEAQAALTQAQALYLKRNYERLLALKDQELISLDAIEDAGQKAEVEARRLDVQKAALERVRREFEEEARKARLAVKRAEAILESVEIRISYTTIRSPITGLVSKVTAQEGETIVAGLQVANLITVLDPSLLEMWIYVDETDVGQVKPGQKVEFNVDAYPGKTFKGTVHTIYPEPEIRDNIVYYQALVDITLEQAEWLRPEMTTQVKIVVAEKDDVLKIPNSALKWVEGRQVVFVRTEAGDIRQVRPGIGLAGLTHSEILSGLKEGDVVATQLVLPGGAAAPRKDGK